MSITSLFDFLLMFLSFINIKSAKIYVESIKYNNYFKVILNILINYKNNSIKHRNSKKVHYVRSIYLENVIKDTTVEKCDSKVIDDTRFLLKQFFFLIELK